MWLELWCWKFSFAITEKNIKIVICIVYCIIWSNKFSLGARFTKQGKLAQERNSKTAPMCMEMSAADLLTTRKWKNTDTTSHLHINQRNIPSTAQISLVANKQSLSSSGASDLLTTLALNSLRRDFWGVNNGANTSNLTTAHVSKSCCVINFNTLLPYILRVKGKLL